MLTHFEPQVRPPIGPYELPVDQFEPQVDPYEPQVGPYEPQVGPFELQVGPFDPQVGPYEPQYGSFKSQVAPSKHHHIGRFSPFFFFGKGQLGAPPPGVFELPLKKPTLQPPMPNQLPLS